LAYFLLVHIWNSDSVYHIQVLQGSVDSDAIQVSWKTLQLHVTNILRGTKNNNYEKRSVFDEVI